MKLLPEGPSLAAKFPHDQGIDQHPAVILTENFRNPMESCHFGSMVPLCCTSHRACGVAPGPALRRGPLDRPCGVAPWTGLGFTLPQSGGEPFEGFHGRTSSALKPTNSVWFDDIVLATEYIGPLSISRTVLPKIGGNDRRAA